MGFAKYLIKKPFYRTPPGACFCSTEKYFNNEIGKNSLKKKKKMETAGKKNNDAEKNLNTTNIKFSYPFTNKKFLSLPFLCFPWYTESTSF